MNCIMKLSLLLFIKYDLNLYSKTDCCCAIHEFELNLQEILVLFVLIVIAFCEVLDNKNCNVDLIFYFQSIIHAPARFHCLFDQGYLLMLKRSRWSNTAK
jgi:hypothetical protein